MDDFEAAIVGLNAQMLSTAMILPHQFGPPPPPPCPVCGMSRYRCLMTFGRDDQVHNDAIRAATLIGEGAVPGPARLAWRHGAPGRAGAIGPIRAG